MESRSTIFPFEVDFDAVRVSPDQYVAAVFSALESEFLILPKGEGFIEYATFERGFEALKLGTSSFGNTTPETILRAVLETPISLVVVRAMLGFTPPEWASVTTQRTGVEVTQGFARSLDRRIRMQPLRRLSAGELSERRVRALIETAHELLAKGTPEVGSSKLHRLDKADTREGWASVRTMAEIGVPYAMVLYERFLGRPFAGHRDSVSELVGGGLESRVEDVLSASGISYRKTRRAERIPGFDQAPDFIVPDEFAPQIVIEAKYSEDDGTARDKVTRVQHLGELSMVGQPPDQPKYEVIACIGGRGFGVRREDMRKLILATRGKVFTLRTLDRMVEHTRLKGFRSK